MNVPGTTAAGGPGAEQTCDVAVGEECDDQRRCDDRRPLGVPVDQRGDAEDDGCTEDCANQRRTDVDEQDFAQVLGVQEQHRVGGEQQGVQGQARNARQRTRFGRLTP